MTNRHRYSHKSHPDRIFRNHKSYKFFAITLLLALAASSSTTWSAPLNPIPQQEIPEINDQPPTVGDQPDDPGPLAKDLLPALRSKNIRVAMRRVADWQLARVQSTPSRDWTFATLYDGFLAASQTLHDPRYSQNVASVADHFHWQLGPRRIHADDQAIGQAYLELYRSSHRESDIASLRTQFDQVLQLPDDPAHPVWWWCDALFMAPPAWAGLSQVTGDAKYTAYMDREWTISQQLLYDPQLHLFSRDAHYLHSVEKNGKKVFWSRGNGWVMGGIVRVLDRLPANDPLRPKYIALLRDMAAEVASIQSPDGLWRPGLLDADAYPLPEVSGSAFFVYSIAWGIRHHVLDDRVYRPVLAKAWAGLLTHVYSNGRLGAIQPIGEAPGHYKPSSSYVFGTGAFLLAASELDLLARHAH